MNIMGNILKRLWGGILLGLIVVQASPAQQGGMPPALVRTHILENRLMAPTVQVPGTLISLQDSEISSELEGQIVWIVEVGDAVEKGDILARLDDRLFKIALSQAEADVKRLQADLKFRSRDLERQKNLAARDNASMVRLDGAVARKAMLEQEVIIARNALALAKYNLDHATIIAPFSGHVVERLMELGEYAQKADPVVRLVDTFHVEIRLQAPLSSAAFVASGQNLGVNGGEVTRQSTIRAVVPVGDPGSRVMEIRLSANAGDWVIGSAVKVSVPTAIPRTIVAVPRDALILSNSGISILKVNGEMATRFTVRIAAASGDYVELIGDVSVGDRVIIRGGERLMPGQPVVEMEGD